MKLVLLPLVLLLSACAGPPAAVDPKLAAEIANIKAIDNHAHPVRPTAAGQPPDTGYDALPVENLEAATDLVRFRPAGNPLIAKAPANPQAGPNYAAEVLDNAGIDRMLANRVAMGPGLPPARFLWVAYADALMYPFPTAALAINSDRKAFFALEEKLLAQYKVESSAKADSLDDYLTKIVTATLERHKRDGALAEKFEMAYLRSLTVTNPTKAEAALAWRTSTNAPALQDFLFRYIAAECGRLGMAVHIHTGAGGGGYFDVAGSNPINLEPLFNDPALRKTNFVMLHGGWPFSTQAAALLTKPNAFIDVSFQGLALAPADVAANLRSWLEIAPDKVLFGTDAYPIAPGIGWEQTAWASTQAVRQALGLALTAMINEGSITRQRAIEIAKLVLRGNALHLYKLQ